jgi:hypothetical protein
LELAWEILGFSLKSKRYAATACFGGPCQAGPQLSWLSLRAMELEPASHAQLLEDRLLYCFEDYVLDTARRELRRGFGSEADVAGSAA